jgi:type IV pilus assembly protein PilY1
MKQPRKMRLHQIHAAVLVLGFTAFSGRAEVTDLANVPLAKSTDTIVQPNLMFILDDSGSMQWSYMPDSVFFNRYYQKIGYRNHLCNKAYYNPNISYKPPLDAAGNSYPNSSFTAASYDGFVSGAPTVNLSTGFMAWRSSSSGFNPPSGFASDCWNVDDEGDRVECTASSSSSSQLPNTAGAAHYYTYKGSKPGNLGDNSSDDHCKNVTSGAGTNWTKVTVSPSSGPGGTDERENFANWYTYYRTRILAMKSAAGRAFASVDDTYRVGFITINPTCPNGSSSSCSGGVRAAKYLKIDDFSSVHKSDWYSKLYSINPAGGTPLRVALSRVGRHFGGKTDGINSGMPEDPVQFSCQQNFSLLTTDGYWNGSAGQKLNGSSIGNQDNVEADSNRPLFDGNLSGSTNTLADVAMYYYKTDLRPAGSTGSLGTDVSEDNVKNTDTDPAEHQHMTTFTLGLGLNGRMTYDSNYDKATTGDFAKVKSGATGCSWQSASAKCNWPVPAADSPSALDDLWHAAVNGRGKYFSASDAATLAQGLSGALAGMKVKLGSAAASATSSPNITQEENSIFSTSYRTAVWDGEVEAQKIDATNGEVDEAKTWSARTVLNGQVAATSDTRTIYTFDSGTETKLKPFLWDSLSDNDKLYFSNKCSALSQCAALDGSIPANATKQTETNSGKNLVEYLRGRTQYEGTHYRDREYALGDMVNSTPVYVRKPRHSFNDSVTPTYGQFKLDNQNRQAMLYVGANDGMLHAFNADNGTEVWAYVPTAVMPNMYRLADNSYRDNHQYFVDGSPVVMDMYVSGAWKTILVGGFNGGGRGYFALDVTTPGSPKALWEFKVRNPSVTACATILAAAVGATDDCDLGYTFGNPVLTKRKFDGKAVVLVTSGYNNVSPGDGKGYLYVLDVADGKILDKIATGTGTTTSPSGLAKISAYADNFSVDNTALRVYGGDLLGNVWRFDLSGAAGSTTNIAQLKDAAGKAQSITTRPELAEIEGSPVVYIGTGRFLGVSDLSDPATLSPPLPYAYQQSFYAFKDKGINNGTLRDNSGMKQQYLAQTDSLSRTTSNPVAIDWKTDTGWFVDFNPGNTSPGERVNIDPQLVLGTLTVATNIPNPNACSGSGSSYVYQFDHKSGSYVSTSGQVTATKIFNDALTVGFVVIQLANKTVKAIINADDGRKETLGVHTGTGSVSTRRISWRELIQN